MSIPRFRVWDPDSQRMMDIEDWAWTIDMIEANLHNDTESPVEEPHIHPWAMFTDMIEEGGGKMLQGTGLKDKNGKEIFEGDLLLATKYADSAKPVEVVYDTKAGAFKAHGSISESQIAKYGLEVVGNVWES